jgi:PAS domain S-box-containing protein
MATQNLKRKKNNNLKDQKRTRSLNNSAIIKPLSAKQMGKRAEEALQEIEERFRLAFENANIGMCLVDLQGRLTKVNHQMCEIFGYSQEELEGMTVNDIAHPEDLNISTTFIQRATSGKIEYTHFEKRYLHKDGHIVWGAVSSSLVRDPQGVPQYFISHVQDITERKRAEEALRQSEEKYRTILENIEDGYFETDIAGNFTFFNNSVCRMLGYSKDEMVGMNNRQYTDKGNAKKLYQAFNKVYRTGEPTKGFDWEIIRKDGTKRYIETSVSLIKNISGQPIGFRGIVRDITERKQAEEGLKDSEERYRKLFENAIDGIVLADLERGIIIDCNKVIGGLVEREKTELIGQSQQILHPPEDSIGEVSRTFVQHRFDKEGQVLETQVITKTGERKRVEIKANILELKGRKVLQGIFRDITERKQAEKKLRESEEKYRTILENIEEGYYEVDIAGNFTFFNDSLCQMLGYIKDELMGMNNRQYTDQENAKKLYQAFNKVYKTGEPEKGFDWEVIRKDGTKRYTETSVSLVKNPSGQPEGFRGIVRDITERKRAEETLKESEEKYRLLVEESIQGIVIVQGIPPRMVFVNPTMTMILGYTFEELSSLSPKGIEGLIHSEDRGIFFKNYKDRLEGKSVPPRYEVRGVRKDGTMVWLELSSTRIGYKGQPAIQAAFLDITERKRAEELLRESEERYRTILENIEDGYFEVDIAGNFTFFNDSVCQMLGYPKEELMGKNNRGYMDQENAKKLYQAFNKVYRTGEPTKGFDWEINRKDGTKRVNEASVSLIRDSKGQPIGFRGISRDITERKRAEEALRTEKQRFQTLSEQAPFGMVMIDQDGTFKYINPKFRELFGYDLTDVPDGKTWFRKAYPDPIYRHNVISEWINDLKSFKPGVKRPRTFIVTCKNGAEKTINFIPVWLPTGENLMACEDITERKRAEEALQESEERYRTILENIEDGYYEVDLPGNFTFFNDSLCRMLGYSKEEMIGMSNQQYTDQENRKKLFQAFNEVYRTGEPTKRFDWEVIRKDRTKLFGEVSASLIKDSKGQPIGFRGIARDITERMMAGEALKKSEVRFQKLFNDAPVGYFEYDVEGCIIDVNRTELELLGYRLDEMIGQPVWKFIVEGEAARQQILQKLTGTLPPAQGLERTYRRKDGTTFPVLVGDRILQDSEGKIIGIRTTIQDISELKRAEEEMRALEEQFRQSQKMEAIGRLGGGIAHDFNNLLTIIKGYSQLSLLDLKESDPLWGNIQEIQKATQRATDLTRQLLAFSRRQILDLKVLDLNTLLRELDKMLRRIIGEDIELVTLLSGDLGRVKIDPGQIEQVIFNLAVNARDAMPSGGKLIIETANVELDKEYANAHIGVVPGRYVRLSVSDTGFGMSREVREKVFEPFFTTKDKGKGTGLGLSTVYGIVKQSSGNIWVYSEPGHGTTFKIYLPRVEEELDTLQGQDETESSSRGSETVLLVEDEPLVRDLAHRILSQQGYKVLEAANGEEALRVVQEHIGEKIHLLLTDVVMPQMGGKELADQLKLLRPDVKVLYTSGYTDDAIVHHGVLEPGTHFLQKPFSPKTLSHKVREVLDR